MDVVLAHGRFGRQSDVGAGPWFVDSSGADEIDAITIRKGGDHIVGIGENGEVEIRQVLNKGEGGGGGVDEDGVVRLYALGGKARDSSFGFPVNLLPFCEG